MSLLATTRVVVAALLVCTALVPAPATASTTAAACPAVRHTTVPLTAVPSSSARAVALTFDDGPSPTWTPKVLDALRSQGVQATFFVTGGNVRAHPALARRIVAEGHTLGNHTYNHPDMTRLSAAGQAKQMDDTDAAIRAAVPGYQVCVFRPPYGAWNSTTLSLARNRGMTVVRWTHDTRDWENTAATSTRTRDSIVWRATTPAHSKANVLFHDAPSSTNRQNTVDAVPLVIRHYKGAGYAFTDPIGRTAPVARTVANADTTIGNSRPVGQG